MTRVSVTTLPVLLALALSTPVLAQDNSSAARPHQTTQAGTNDGAAPDEKKICRRLLITGTRMAKSTCRTQAEWNAQAAVDSTGVNRSRDTSGNLR